MDRKEFIKTCGYTCLGIVGISLVMESCSTTKYITASPTENVITISKKEFIELKKNKEKILRYIIIRTKEIDFPIVLYRFSENEYSALSLRCSHQGSELNVNGDLLTCTAHGSEFTNKGEIVQGPADVPLTKYKNTNDQKNIYIEIK
jgi:Rieske Fe-S protein